MSLPVATRFTRWVGVAILASLFTLVGLVGRNSSITLSILALLLIFAPGSLQTLRNGSRNPIDWIFYGSVIGLGIGFALSAEDFNDFKYILNFAPYLLIAPMRKQFERLAVPDAARHIAFMALAGTVILCGIAIIEVILLDQPRARGQMNPFQFVYTTMLLGYLSLAGLFAPGRHPRWPFLIAPVLATFTVMISGTRGALLAVPVLTLLALIFALVTLPDRRRLIAIGGAVAVAGFVVLYLIALQLGLTRSISGLDVPRQILAGEQLDQSSFERLTMLRGAWGAFLDSPIWGHGWPNMVPAIFPHVPPDTLERMQTFRHLHNGFANFASGAGLIGLVSFVLVLAAPVIGTVFTPRDSQWAARLYLALTLSLGFLAFEFTYILLGFDFHGFQFVLMTAVILGYVHDAPPHSAEGTAGVGPETSQTA